jgi:hypothetical protein
MLLCSYPYLYYTNAIGGVCVKECPSLKGMTADNLTDMHTLITYTGVYQTTSNMAEVPLAFVQVANYSYTLDEPANATSLTIFDMNNFQCTDELCFGDSVTDSFTTTGVNRGFGFAYYLADSYPIFQRCFLTAEARDQIANLTGEDLFEDVISTSSDLGEANDFVSHLYGDMWIAKSYIFGFGFGISIVVSLLYMMLLRIPGILSSLVWFSIFSVIVLFATGGYYASERAKEWKAANPPVVREDEVHATEVGSYILYGISAILFLLAICLRKQIQVAVSCVKQAARAINNMVLIFAIPVLQGIGFLSFTVVWAYYGSYLASLGSITLEYFEIPATGFSIPVRTYEFSDNVNQLGWFLIFCFYWTSSFILAIGEMAVSMAISKWYFTVDKSDVTQHVPFVALWSTIIYHLGTCAFGSLIIAIIKLLRSLLNSLQKNIAKATNESIAKALLCCCQCCLCCLEKCVQFMNENAYIQVRENGAIVTLLRT